MGKGWALTDSSCFDAAEVVYHVFGVFEIEQSVVTVRKMGFFSYLV